MNIDKILSESLRSLGSNFDLNELAYLSLTTKIELPFRDRWAYNLFKQINSASISVSREWKRTDLAILENKNPLALVELKAMYTFDAALFPEKINGFPDKMLADEDKAKKLCMSETDVYTVLLATHPESKIPSKYEGIIKYHPGINKANKRFSSADEVKKEAIKAVDNKNSKLKVIAQGELKGGNAFGIDVSVLYWLIKA